MKTGHPFFFAGVALAVAMAYPGGLTAETWRVEVKLSSGVARAPLGELVGEVLAKSPDARSGVIRRLFSCNAAKPCVVEIELPAEKGWLLTAEVPDYGIGEPVPVEKGSPEIWPAGKVRGQAVFPKDSPPQGDLLLRFHSPAQGSSGTDGKLDGESICSLSEGAFECSIPAGEVDASLRARGHVRVYRWGLRVAHRGTVQMGRVEFRKEASLVGQVISRDPAAPKPGSCRVRLQPTGDSPKLPASAPALPSAPVDGRGFFHLEVIPPGRWEIVAEQEGFIPSRLPVTILEGAEARLKSPIVLSRPVRLEVVLSPQQDPEGKPWMVELMEYKGENAAEIVAESPASPGGAWSRDGLGAGGRYRLRVLTFSRNRWWSDDLPFSPETTPFRRDIHLDVERVGGSVTLGGKPLRCRVVFGTEHGVPSVPVESDETGKLEGYLPRLGKWNVDVIAESPSVMRKLEVDVVRRSDGKGEVIVALADRALQGDIVTEDDAPAPRALLRVFPSATNQSTEHHVEGGRFRLDGLEPGDYVLSAIGPGLISEDVRITLSEEAGANPVKIVLRKENRLKVRVQSASEVGLAGVPVWYLASSPGHSSYVKTTDADGRVSFGADSASQFECLAIADPTNATEIVAISNSGEEQSVTLAATGGSLSLGYPDPSPNSYPVLYRGACSIGPTMLSYVKRSPDRKRFLNLSPGDYTLCLKGLAYGPSLGGPCKQGTLTPYGTLDLSVGITKASK